MGGAARVNIDAAPLPAGHIFARHTEDQAGTAGLLVGIIAAAEQLHIGLQNKVIGLLILTFVNREVVSMCVAHCDSAHRFIDMDGICLCKVG